MIQSKRALITAEFDGAHLAQLSDMGYTVEHGGWGQTREPLSLGQLLTIVPPVSLLIVEVEQVSAEIIAAAPKLDIVATCRAGPVNVDVAAATKQGVCVLTPPGRNADSVADFALGLVLALCRNISRAERHLRQNGWMVRSEIPYFHFRGPELAGRTLGLVGFGAVGRAFARRVQGFDMRVLVADPYLAPGDIGNLGELAPLESVLAQADLLSLHVPLNEQTTGMIGVKELALMRPTAYLINTARAAVVDEEALFTALSQGRLAGAALDVFWNEPQIAARWFSLDNVLLTPHLAGAADDVKAHHAAMIIQDLQTLATGAVPERLVNPEVLNDQGRLQRFVELHGRRPAG
jgi:phosphoglycerate dehydrogenase-like enzyme